MPGKILNILILTGALCLLGFSAWADTMTVERYMKEKAGPGSKVFLPGLAKVAGQRVFCGRRPVLIDNDFSDYGGAYPGFVILNRSKLKHLPKSVKLYIFAHECGHQFRGRDEAAADCYSVKRGRREGWLSKKGLEQVCKFMLPHVGDRMHPPGPQRCKMMRKCYKNAFKNRELKAQLKNNDK